MTFKPATREKSRLRMTIDGPAGSGKTYTALRFAHELVNAYGGKIAFIDTEHGSASKYVGDAPDGIPWQFDVVELSAFSPEQYTQLIQEAGRNGDYSVLVIDSLSHAWSGVGGALDIKERASGNNYTAWRTVTPIHNRMVEAILQSPLHVITTMRSKMDYVQDTNEYGKIVAIRRVGMAPVQRPGTEYEFDVVIDIDYAHVATISKSRCPAIADMKIEKPGPELIRPVIEWLQSGIVPVRIPTLDDLITQYGVNAIMAASGGNVPSTPDEIREVAEKLAQGGA